MSSLRPRTAVAAVPPTPPRLHPRKADEASAPKQTKKDKSTNDHFLAAQERAYANGLSGLLAHFDSLSPSDMDKVELRRFQDMQYRREQSNVVDFNIMAILKMSLREFDVTTPMSVHTDSDDGFSKTFTVMCEEQGRNCKKPKDPLVQLKNALSKIGSSKLDYSMLSADHTEDILDFVLAGWHRCSQQGSLDVPYTDHTTCLLELLKSCRAAGTQAEQRLASSRVTNFVTLTSCGKILRRLEYGVHGSRCGGNREVGARWIFDIITTPIEDFPKRAHTLPCVDPTPTKEQSEKQRRTLMRFWESQDIEEYTQIGYRYGSIYDLEGRKRFHFMLSKRLLAAKRELSELQMLIEVTKATPIGEVQPATLKEDIGRVLHRLLLEMRGLSDIHLNFSQILYAHLRWLSRVTGAVFAHHEPDFSEHGRSPSPRAMSRTDGPMMPIDGDVTYCQGESSSDEVVQIESRGDPRHFPREATRHDQWATTAEEYLLLISDHDLRVISAVSFNPEVLCPAQRVKSMMIQGVELNVITVSKQSEDTKSISLERCLSLIVKKSLQPRCGNGTKLEYSKLRAILDTSRTVRSKSPCFWKRRLRWLSGSPDTVSNALTGPHAAMPHCEAFAMALSACLDDASLRKILIASCTNSKSACVADREIGSNAVRFVNVRALRNTFPAVQYPTLRRCCPACWIIVRLANAMQGNATVIHPAAKPGEHTRWSKIDLPVWTPRWLGLELIREMEKEAFKMLGRVQTEYENRKAQASYDLRKAQAEDRRRKAQAEDENRRIWAKHDTRMAQDEQYNRVVQAEDAKCGARIEEEQHKLQAADEKRKIPAEDKKQKTQAEVHAREEVESAGKPLPMVTETKVSKFAPVLPPLDFSSIATIEAEYHT